MKPKTIKVPTVSDVREFIESIDRDSLIAATSPLRGIEMGDQGGVKRTYDWLLHYAKTGGFPID